MAVVSRRGSADQVAIGIEQRLVAERVCIRDAVNLERDEAVRHALLELLFESLLADERPFVQAHEAVEAGLVGSVIRG